MSEAFEPGDQRDGCDCICPHCGDRYQVEIEDIDERVREQECGECGKVFEYWAEITVDHCTRKKETE